MSTLLGTKVNNKIIGTSLNDILAGLGGDDTLIGGDGNDIAWYAGLTNEFLIGTTGSFLMLKDTNLANGDDGLDRLSGIETLSFGNAALTLSGGETQVNTYSTSSQNTPAIAALADGGYVVTWMSVGQDGSDYGVYAQRYDAQSNTVGGETQVNTYTLSDQYMPAITALADGGYVVTWMSSAQDGSSLGIYLQRYDVQSNKVGGETQVNTYTLSDQDTPAIAALADGGYVVTWASVGQDGSDYGVYAQRYDAQSNTVGGETQVNTYTTSYQVSPDIAALADGGYVVTWASDGQDGSDLGVYAQCYDDQGNKVGGETQVNTYTLSDQYMPAIAALADGGYVVTWASVGQDGSDYGVYAQRYDAQSNTVGGETQVNTYTSMTQCWQDIVALADGGYVVTWVSVQQDGSSGGIFLQRYNTLGNKTGDEVQVNTYTNLSQHDPAITALADGGYVVTWDSDGPDGDVIGVFAQRYDAAGNAVGLKVSGSAGADTLNVGLNTLLTVDGAGGNDIIAGGLSDDNLLGGAGNDKLTGGDGSDHLDGGVGADTLIGGNGGDNYVVDSALDVITETGIDGSDSVMASVTYTLGATLENLTLIGSGNINASGNASGNLLVGNGGNNILDGKAGADLMVGGYGNDTYIVDNLFDLVAEDLGAGIDKVKSAVDFTLGDNIDDLELTGILNLMGTGNALNNVMLGNAGNNVMAGNDGDDNLNGGAGNDNLSGVDGVDWLIGGLGADTLTGGTGNDIFRFDTAPSAMNADHVTDFATAADQIQLSLALFKNSGLAGVLSSAEFTTGSGFAAADLHHVLYETGTGKLYYNADGAGAGALVLICTLDTHPALAASDVWLV